VQRSNAQRSDRKVTTIVIAQRSAALHTAQRSAAQRSVCVNGPLRDVTSGKGLTPVVSRRGFLCNKLYRAEIVPEQNASKIVKKNISTNGEVNIDKNCHQSNYSSRMVLPSYLLNLAKPEIALFDPPTSKIPS